MITNYSPRTDSIDLKGTKVLHIRDQVWGTVEQDDYSSLMVVWDDDAAKKPDFVWITKVHSPTLQSS
jgi:hypothetical protein